MVKQVRMMWRPATDDDQGTRLLGEVELTGYSAGQVQEILHELGWSCRMDHDHEEQ